MEKQYFESFVEKKEGKMLAVASDDTFDRMGDSLSADKWDLKNFLKNPVLQLSHNYDAPPVGIAKNIRIEGKRLLFEPIFHEITQVAKEIKQLYEAGIMRAFSVGFIPPKGEEKDATGKYELLEISAVAIPANPNALITAKKFDAKTIKEVSAWVCKMVNGKIECPNEAERWNKKLSKVFNKAFDISKVDSIPANFSFEVFTKFFECQVKDIFVNNFFIPSPLLGNYLSAFKKIFSEMDLADTRNFTPTGMEFPPQYEVIQLTADEKSEFLIEGTQFYKKEGKNKIALIYSPNWSGLVISLVSSQSEKEFNKEILAKTELYAKENNKLKGQKFALSGEFLEQTNESFDSVVLEEDTKSSIIKTINALKTNKEFTSRGLMFVGKPGTGKTKTGRIIMSEAKEQTFIWVSSKDFFKIGEIGALRLSFQMARELAPSILFMEDIDSWLKNGYAIDLLKTEMDGLRQNKGIVTILTSNTPEKFPDALLDRPGRFHEVLNFSLPNAENRKKILKLYLGEETAKSITNEVLDNIIKETEDYSAAHIKELVDFAKMIMQEETIDIGGALIKSLEKLKKQKLLINNIKEGKSMEKEITKEDLKLEKAINKSPKCRMKDETEEACRSRKIGEMIDEGYEKEQAAAVAYKLCAIACEEKAIPKEGDVCNMEDGTTGEIHPDKDGNMICMKKVVEPKEGDECEMDDGIMGEMHPDDDGHMVCMKKKAIENLRDNWNKIKKELLDKLLNGDLSEADIEKELANLKLSVEEIDDLVVDIANAYVKNDDNEEQEDTKGGPGSGEGPHSPHEGSGSGRGKFNPARGLAALRRLLKDPNRAKPGKPRGLTATVSALVKLREAYKKSIENNLISKKNKELLMNAKKDLEKAVSALTNLIDLSEVMSGEDKQVKVGEPKEAKTSDKRILRALQTIAKNSNFALSQIKKER